MDREKVIKAAEICLRYIDDGDCPTECPYFVLCAEYEKRVVFQPLIRDALALLKEQEAKPPIHIHEEYPEHDWETDEDGKIDEFAMAYEYHNGPMCKRCYHSFCIHCNPNGFNDGPCIIDKYECPKCGRHISKDTKFCSNCGQEVKWDD